MKKIIILILILMVTILTGCNKKLDRPEDYDCDLWLLDDVTNYDFSEYDEITDWMGASEYLDKKYEGIKTSEGVTRPTYYVSYVITNYPDYSSKKQAVTQLIIADPNVSIYGFNISLSTAEFFYIFEQLGYKGSDESGYRVSKGDIVISFVPNESILLSAKVTNKKEINF